MKKVVVAGPQLSEVVCASRRILEHNIDGHGQHSLSCHLLRLH